MRLVEGQDICLAIPYPRIQMDLVLKDQKFRRFADGEECFENDELVDFAFKHGNRSLLNCFDNKQQNSTREGLSLRLLNDNSYAVVINTPSPFIMSVKMEDIIFFKLCPSYNHVDKLWTRMLVRNNRIKVVGSSDLAFCVELTGLEKERELKENSLFNDKFGYPGQRYASHFVYNSFYSFWRGKKKEKRFNHHTSEYREREGLNV